MTSPQATMDFNDDTTPRLSAGPVCRQWIAAKQQHPDVIFLWAMGDFYETFGADAVTVAKLLDLTLASRGHGYYGFVETVEMCGFPVWTLDRYLPKLTQAGLRVAVCEQQP